MSAYTNRATTDEVLRHRDAGVEQIAHLRLGSASARRTLSIWHRQLVASSQLNLGDRQRVDNLLPADTADFSPDLEFLGPGCSVLGGSDMITA